MGREVGAGEQRGRGVSGNESSAKCIAWKAGRASTRSLALPLRSTSNEMEFSGERSESAATTG